MLPPPFFPQESWKKILDSFQEDIKSGLQSITMNLLHARSAEILLAVEAKGKNGGLERRLI